MKKYNFQISKIPNEIDLPIEGNAVFKSNPIFNSRFPMASHSILNGLSIIPDTVPPISSFPLRSIPIEPKFYYIFLLLCNGV